MGWIIGIGIIIYAFSQNVVVGFVILGILIAAFIIFCIIGSNDNSSSSHKNSSSSSYSGSTNTSSSSSLDDALFAAIYQHDLNAVESAILGGANVNSVSPEGMTPLFFAISKDDIEIVKILVRNGADTNYIMKGLTPFRFARANGYEDIASFLEYA